jgi:predicted Na+-dependent transporter
MPIRRHWFLIGLLLIVGLALSLGRNIDQAGWGPLLRNSAVFLIFLGTGYSLDTRRILQDLAALHHHLAVQLFIFLGVPVLILVPAFLIGGNLADPAVWVGLAAVAVLPTTISSCIAFTQVAGGNVPLSMLNSALSNALGILLSPLLLSLLIGLAPEAVQAGGVTTPAATGGAVLLGREATLSIFGSLARLMVAPAIIGQVVRILLLRRQPASDAPGASRVRPLNSVLMLPLVFYHLWQLVVAGIVESFFTVQHAKE